MQYFAYPIYAFISLMTWGLGRSNLMQPWKQLFFCSSWYQGSPDSVLLGSTIGCEVTDHDNAIKKQHVVLNIDRSWIPGSATFSNLFFASFKQSWFQTHCLALLHKNMFPVPADMNNYKLTKKSLHIVSNKLGHFDLHYASCIPFIWFLWSSSTPKETTGHAAVPAMPSSVSRRKKKFQSQLLFSQNQFKI